MVAVGASAGGVEAVSRLVADLPVAFPAPVLVTIHISRSSPSVLPAILARAGKLPVSHAVNGEAMVPGRIYVAPPDHHLVVDDGRMWCSRGPRENGNRPAVDPMFRAVAASAGRRAVGVVLTGALNDGTAGLFAIKQGGGIAVVQSPAEAVHKGMPESAVTNVDVDAVLPLDRIAGYLVDVLNADAGTPEEQAPGSSAVGEDVLPPDGSRTSAYSCPECGGVLWEVAEPFPRFRCRVGHAYTPEVLLADQVSTVEDALWTALRALEERASLSRRMADAASERGHAHSARRFLDSADEAERGAVAVRDLLGRSGPPVEG